MNNVEEIKLNKFSDNFRKKYKLEVGLENPEDWWDLHNDYPLAFKNIKTMLKCENVKTVKY